MTSAQMNEFLKRLGLDKQLVAVPGTMVGDALFPALNAILDRIERLEQATGNEP